jgi:hypothetical protein
MLPGLPADLKDLRCLTARQAHELESELESQLASRLESFEALVLGAMRTEPPGTAAREKAGSESATPQVAADRRGLDETDAPEEQAMTVELKVENLPKAPPPKGQQTLFGEGVPK